MQVLACVCVAHLLRCGMALTVDMMMASASSPWQASTDSTCRQVAAGAALASAQPALPCLMVCQWSYTVTAGAACSMLLRPVLTPPPGSRWQPSAASRLPSCRPVGQSGRAACCTG